MLRDEEKNLLEILPEIGAAKQKRVFAAFPEAFGAEWVLEGDQAAAAQPRAAWSRRSRGCFRIRSARPS